MTTYTIPAELLQELISNCMASIAEDGISDARRVYRTELHHRANLAMRNLQPNTQEPVAYVSRIAENGRPDIGWLDAEGIAVGDKLYTLRALAGTGEITVADMTEDDFCESFISGDKTPLHEVESMIANALAAHGVKQ